tara:strand:+ start:58 stop:288 length:231 start_codon:yes stop_codon:yes gene_type:complete
MLDLTTENKMMVSNANLLATLRTEFLNRSLYSDMHKEAYGYRPRAAEWGWAMTCSMPELKAHIDMLHREIENAIDY